MNAEPGPFEPETSAARKPLFSGSTTGRKLKIALGFAVVISLAATQISGSRAEVQCTAFVQAPAGLTLIAHAGGGLVQGDYSNTRDALDQSLAHGFELFELDFNWTSDGDLAIGRDWNVEYRHWNRLGWIDWLASFFAAPSTKAYEASTPKFGLTRLSLDSLLAWLRNHPGQIVTDFKSGNLEGLGLIASKAQDLQHRFIPQIYTLPEYNAVRDLGYEKVIFTTYRLSPSADVLKQIDALDLFAITVPGRDVVEAAKIISNNRILTHTINAPVTLPASGYYTDCLIPAVGV